MSEAKMIKKPIAEATVAELIQFANNMGIEVSKSATRPVVMAKLQPAWDNDYIMLMAEQEAMQIAAPSPDQDSSKDEKVWVIIDMQEGPGGEEPVPLSVNGRALFVPRGKPCQIAQRYVEVLRHAKQTTYTQDKDQNMIPRTVFMYPWRTLSMAEAKSFQPEAA